MKTISQAAKSADLPTKTVRYYADIGLVPATERTAAGYRSYDPTAVRRLIFVRRARAFGFGIDECRDLLSLSENNDRASADVKHIAAERLKEIEKRQRDLQELHNDLAAVVDRCNGDSGPDCAIIDYFA